MPYRAELKRPDLKGTFPCSVCGKIFCHSSSLSRHRMQAHFKSYTCTLCSQEISSNETLRSHMFRAHQISRMFMCRCCNWAFPDKTSLHIHMQSMMRNGSPGDVHILAKSSTEGNPALLAPSPTAESPIPTLNGTPTPIHNGIFPSVVPSRDQLLSALKERASASLATNGHTASPTMQLEPQSLLAAWLANNFSNPWATAAANAENGNAFNDSQLDAMEVQMDESDIKREEMENEVEEGALVIADDDEVTSPVTKVEPVEDETLPILRSAISANPLNSLMYHKKLNNALRNKSQRERSLNNFFYSPPAKDNTNIDETTHQQPSPVGSDSQTSSSGAPLSAASDSSSPLKCFECQVLKGKLSVSENRSRFLESKVGSMESKVLRLEQQIGGLESSGRRYESEHQSLREQCDLLEQKLISCQEKALRFLQSEPPEDMKTLLQELLQTTQLS